jgi:predicted  nucleic acid-binding Zn-ribbon protein
MNIDIDAFVSNFTEQLAYLVKNLKQQEADFEEIEHELAVTKSELVVANRRALQTEQQLAEANLRMTQAEQQLAEVWAARAEQQLAEETTRYEYELAEAREEIERLKQQN